MVEGINDHTRGIVDLRRHMWIGGIEEDLRRLIWQIAVVGKYISAKIHESNRKLAASRMFTARISWRWTAFPTTS